jgi:hypothetical protein
MQFKENTEVIYDGIFARIAHVGENYITLALPSQTRQSARLIVYRENFKKILFVDDL